MSMLLLTQKKEILQTNTVRLVGTGIKIYLNQIAEIEILVAM